MILDRANEDVTIWSIVQVPDGYGGLKPGTDPALKTLVKGFVLPTGFAGAGWAANLRYEAMGFAETGRATVIVKWRPDLVLRQWGQVETRGQEWTVVAQPREWNYRRTRFLSSLVELKGDAHGAGTPQTR